jgi:UDPglucose 6-dehydrogenase
MKISVVGTGYVGLTLSALLSRIGYKVHCLDIDKEKIDTIKKGKSYFFEAGLDTLVKYGIESGNLIPTLDYKEGVEDADIIFICVGTPSLEDGSFDLSGVFASVQMAARYAKNGVIFVQRSTVPVGTGRKIMGIIGNENDDLNYEYLSSPEFLREGSAVFDSLIQDRVVVGGEKEDVKEKIFEIFAKLERSAPKILKESPEISKFATAYIHKNGSLDERDFKEKCVSTRIESAELIKVCSNTFLAMKITFANNISRACDVVGANINEVMDGVGMDKRIGRSFLYAGLGFGGGCFPKDIKGLIRSFKEIGVNDGLFEKVLEINNEQIHYVIESIKKMGVQSSSKVGVLGLAFKPGTSDVRESPACILCKELVKEGYVVNGTDPKAITEARENFKEEKDLKYVNTVEEVFKDSEVVILATEWPEYMGLNYKRLSKIMKEKNFYDARNCLDRDKMSEIFNFNNLGA